MLARAVCLRAPRQQTRLEIYTSLRIHFVTTGSVSFLVGLMVQATKEEGLGRDQRTRDSQGFTKGGAREKKDRLPGIEGLIADGVEKRMDMSLSDV